MFKKLLEKLKTFKNNELKQVSAISTVAFHEIIREKIMWSSFLFGILCVGLSLLVSNLSFTDNTRIAIDFGLASISIITCLIAVIMGSSLISKEIALRTYFLVLTKPIARWQFVMGRYLGLLKVLTLNLVLMSLILAVVMLATSGKIYFPVFMGVYLFIFEYAVLAAIACIFSSFTTAASGAVFTSGIWLIGHAMEDIRMLSEKFEPAAMRFFLKLISYLLPDLTRFDIKAEVSHQMPINITYLFGNTLYGIFYALFALAFACLIFRKREL